MFRRAEMPTTTTSSSWKSPADVVLEPQTTAVPPSVSADPPIMEHLNTQVSDLRYLSHSMVDDAAAYEASPSKPQGSPGSASLGDHSAPYDANKRKSVDDGTGLAKQTRSKRNRVSCDQSPAMFLFISIPHAAQHAICANVLTSFCLCLAVYIYSLVSPILFLAA